MRAGTTDSIASRQGGRALLSAPAESNHICQFYEGEDHLFEAVSRFLGAGLAAGEPVVVVATEAHRDGFERRLERAGFDVARAKAHGKVLFLEARALLSRFMAGLLPDGGLFHAVVGGLLDRVSGEHGDRRIRVYGEMVDVLWREGNPQGAVQLEELWNDLGQTRAFSLLCAYVMGNFYREADREPFDRICAAHTHVLPTERYAHADDDAGRLRDIAALQQRAHALETELSRRKELERALREADRHKDEFLAMLGHELRNPLSPILTAVQLMRLRGDGGAREREVIERQARHLSRLVDDLLDVSRITRGKVELKKETLEIARVLAAALESATPLLEQGSHVLTIDVPSEGLRVEGDPVRLVQVFANLLTNAAKYAEPGGKVSLTAWREGGEVAVRVKDQGHGISEEALPRIFELFVQGERGRIAGGLGVGLALVQNLVRLHQGTVTAHSEGPGLGAEFEVRLPVLQASTPLGLPVRPTRTPLGSALRVLIVDDNVDAAEMLADAFRQIGHQVLTAYDGPQALRRAQDFRPTTILLDIGLPVMDGYELATKLRETLASSTAPRLIAITGYGQEADRAKSRAAGIELHLAKPVDLDQLEEILSQATPTP